MLWGIGITLAIFSLLHFVGGVTLWILFPTVVIILAIIIGYLGGKYNIDDADGEEMLGNASTLGMMALLAVFTVLGVTSSSMILEESKKTLD